MNCPKCGAFNNEGSNFCIKCGQSIIASQPNIVTPQPVETEIQVQPNVVTPEPVQTEVQAQPNVVTPQPVETEIQVQPNVVTPQPVEIQTQVQPNVVTPQPVQTETQVQQTIVEQPAIMQSINQPISNNSQPVNNINSTSNIDIMSYLSMIIMFILKPFTALEEHTNKFDNIKLPAIISLVISGVATIIKLVTSIINVVKVENYSWLTGKTTTTWVWDNLKEFNFIEVIGKNFLIYLGIIASIAIVYYIATLIIKKQVNFSRILGISAIAVIPALSGWLIISPIIGMIYEPLGMIIMIAGFVYSIIIAYEGINNEIVLEGNAKFYINAVCLSVLAVAAYYLFINLFMSSVTGGLGELGGLLDMFK